jgi:hypothetical protein
MTWLPEQTKGTVESLGCWQGHGAILASLAVRCVLLATGLRTVIRDTPFPELSQIQKAVLDSGKAQAVGASVQKTWSGGEARTGLLVSVVCRGQRSNAEQDATEIADIVLRTDSHAAGRDFITVIFQQGFVVGFARFSNNRQISHDPATWLTRPERLGLR